MKENRTATLKGSLGGLGASLRGRRRGSLGNNLSVCSPVIPAKAGIQRTEKPYTINSRGHWIPAFAGMTVFCSSARPRPNPSRDSARTS
ncbi:MAG: hypothetical protein F4X66_12430 [Chloroflexi bacterium]|nr:hypothetical protein [Chloroflexota bacterium]MYE39110.1 hypothetical protein [Chloroflexota bacterium]